jgi:hypothetical protein
MAVGRLTDATARKTATLAFLFQSEHRRTSPSRSLTENRRGEAITTRRQGSVRRSP